MLKGSPQEAELCETLAPVDKIEGPSRSAPRPPEAELCENHAPVDRIKGPGSPALTDVVDMHAPGRPWLPIWVIGRRGEKGCSGKRRTPFGVVLRESF